MDAKIIEDMVAQALSEDIGSADVSAQLIDAQQRSQAQIICREDMILCGRDWAESCFHALDPNVTIEWQAHDGAKLMAGAVIAKLSGNSRALLSAERSALNFLQSLSACATQTAEFVDAVTGTNCKILDTRKTIPGWRLAQKYAVRCGGGYNHRLGLYDAFLIKENHIKACGGIAAAIAKAQRLHPTLTVEIEVEDLTQFAEALNAKPNIIMLDNFSLADIKQAISLNNSDTKLEVSGNVDLNSVKALAETGVDCISIGALTKNIRAIDLSLLLI